MDTYNIPEQNLEILKQKIAKLSRRAERLHLGAITLTIVGEHLKEVSERDEFDRLVKVFHKIIEVQVSGPTPKINGWSFVAVLQPVSTEEGESLGNMLRVVPGVEIAIPEKFRNASQECEHCHTARRRNETFVLRSDAGDFKQVGRQCLRDFLGHQSPEALAEFAQYLIDAADIASMGEDEGFGGGRAVERYEAEEFLALAAATIRLYGFRSRKTAEMNQSQSTSGLIAEWLSSSSAGRAKFNPPIKVEDGDKQQAAEVYSWLQSLAERDTTGNDYMYNLSLLGRGATFTARNFGLATSAVSTWAKEMEREINRKKRLAADAASEYVGQAGERLVFTATLVYTTDLESDFGVTTLYKFKTAEGNIIVYFASRKVDIGGKDIEMGQTVTLKGSVKEHEERKGIKQTRVTRCSAYVPPKTAKAIKILQHAAQKGIYGGFKESSTCPDSPHAHNYNVNFCKQAHEMVWEDFALYGNNEDWTAGKLAEATIQKLIDELTAEAQPSTDAPLLSANAA